MSDGDLSAPETNGISVEALSSLLWGARYYVAVGVVLGALLGGIAAGLITPVYRVQVVAVPARFGGQMGLSGTVGQLSGLAALAGLDVTRVDNSAEHLEYLKSRTLTQHFITKNELLPVLYSGRWDARRKQWKRLDKIPTMDAAVRLFNKRIRSVSEDRRTSVLTLAINWKNRQQAAQWANDYMELANRELARRAIVDAEATLNYLNSELPRASSLGVQQALYHLIEDEQKLIALANTRKEFAFRVVDQADAPDPKEYVSPNRPLILAVSTIGCALLGAVLWRLMNYRRSRQVRATQ